MMIHINPLFKRLFAYLASFLSLMFFSMSSYADHSPPNYNRGDVVIRVVNDYHTPFAQYSANARGGVSRVYLEAIKGKKYAISIRNRTNKRIGIVVAVDGRNILSGKKSWLRNTERMYILDPYKTQSYKGWRTGTNKVNRFYFTTANRSFANAWGDSTAMGVIAIAVYYEKRSNNFGWNDGVRKPSASINKRAPANEAGTGFGQTEYSPSKEVSFSPQNKARSKYFIKYEWRATLCKKKVITCYAPSSYPPKNRFWPDSNNRQNNRNHQNHSQNKIYGFVQPPPGHH